MAKRSEFSPFVYWGQDKKFLFLRVDLRNCSSPDVQLTSACVKFSAFGEGLHQAQNYAFEIELFGEIDPEDSKWRLNATGGVEMKLSKTALDSAWPRLQKAHGKPGWLKVDFDKIQTDGESEDEMEQAAKQEADRLMMERIEKELEAVQPGSGLGMAQAYLFTYNSAQFMAFLYINFTLWFELFTKGPISKYEAWERMSTAMYFCQTMMLAEVLHPLLGLTKGAAMQPFMQVCGRALALYVISLAPATQTHFVVWYLFVAWSAIELVRYPFYMLSVLGLEFRLVSWLRYTLWIPLYPLGVFCEMFAYYKSLPDIEASGSGSVRLPNSWNFGFDLPTLIRVYLVLIVPLVMFLFKHLWIQRQRRFGSNKTKTD